ncbi:LysM peptidoglycan-binding domain-containing protein [Mitsuaria sp. WAJ17]|uniref:LysM peptidoglycan-binding domain-containing protein n=1 Tax=Mitsuaria sp. WAJ17 TaxID=2761452 RepID=UPI0016013368|nr:LysM peptidoglycan-binding domain-containing protein [Mitsuaria sp. WAJ17]MBB2486258.1 LysM peptidoglycan-binding domain-containing protein [Mitsuaria sp. WAJ17]
MDDIDRYNIRYEYDAVGNRRMIDANYWDGPTGGRLDRQTYWYAYDAMNRFVVSKGQLNTTVAGTDLNRFADAKRGTSLTDSSVNIISGEFGIKLGYDKNSQRVSAQYVFNGAATTDTYKYSGDGYLQLTNINGVLKVTRELDALGRTVVQHDIDTVTGISVSGQHTRSEYDLDNRLLSQNFVDDKDGKRNYALSYLYYEAVSGSAARYAYDEKTASMSGAGKGALAKTVLRPAEGKETTTTYTYQYWDDAKQYTIVKANADVGTGTTQMSYDVNGNLLFSNDAVSKVTSTFVTTANGLILSRTRMPDSGQNVSHHYFYYVDSHRIGDVGDTPDEIQRVSYAEQLALKDARRKDPDAKGRTYGRLIRQAEFDKEESSRKGHPVLVTDAVYGSTADFDQNYEPINDNYPGHAASLYTVQRDSETLASIAQTLWGDAAMWYLIADANGLTASATLKSGQLLVIPNKVTNIHNNAKTWRPYQAGEAIGKTDPTMPTPPPPKSSGCGGLGMLLMVVVAVAVTVYTAGALTAGVSGGFGATMSAGVSTLAGTGLSLGGAIAIGAASAAVGSIASQAVGLAIGQIDSFSWRAVGQAALGGAITSGVGNVLGGPAASSAVATPGRSQAGRPSAAV